MKYSHSRKEPKRKVNITPSESVSRYVSREEDYFQEIIEHYFEFTNEEKGILELKLTVVPIFIEVSGTDMYMRENGL